MILFVSGHDQSRSTIFCCHFYMPAMWLYVISIVLISVARKAFRLPQWPGPPPQYMHGCPQKCLQAKHKRRQCRAVSRSKFHTWCGALIFKSTFHAYGWGLLRSRFHSQYGALNCEIEISRQRQYNNVVWCKNLIHRVGPF